MKKLNSKQKEAAESLKGAVLVLAGAGSGKTTVLTERIINLILNGVMPQNILAITFTNKAAGEMRERIQKAIEKHPKISFPVYEREFKPFISTFHSLGVYILRDNYERLGISRYFSIYDKNDSKKILKSVLEKMNYDLKEWDPGNILSVISKSKSDFIDIDNFFDFRDENPYNKTIFQVWAEYEKIKEKEKALDFDDLILKSLKLLISDREVREHYLRKWTHLHIDEYQDTNKIQNTFVSILTNPDSNNIFVVGDDDQSIYGWRGSEVENILNFEKKFKKVKKIFLEENYRSTKNIIEASNSVIDKNNNRYPKKLYSNKEEGEKIVIYNAFNEKDEAEFVAEEISGILKEWKRDGGGKNENDIAILYRSNFQSRILEEFLLKKGISYRVLGVKFFDRAEVKDIISYLRFALNKKSMTDLKRIINNPRRGIGKVSVLKIISSLDNDKEIILPAKIQKAYNDFLKIIEEINFFIEKENNKKVSDLIEFIIKISGFEKKFTENKNQDDLEKLSNIYELVSFAEKYNDFNNLKEAVENFLEEISLISDQDSNDNSKENPAVRLMTIHASKGLEFETVFLTGAEERFFSPIDVEDKNEYEKKSEEERRLFYVAMTRAKTKLYFTWAFSRTVYGKTEFSSMVDFINDIPGKYLVEIESGKNDGEEIEYLEW